jgi:hypothetical protein
MNCPYYMQESTRTQFSRTKSSRTPIRTTKIFVRTSGVELTYNKISVHLDRFFHISQTKQHSQGEHEHNLYKTLSSFSLHHLIWQSQPYIQIIQNFFQNIEKEKELMHVKRSCLRLCLRGYGTNMKNRGLIMIADHNNHILHRYHPYRYTYCRLAMSTQCLSKQA